MENLGALFLRSLAYTIEGVSSDLTNFRDRYFDQKASSFYDRLVGGGFDPNSHIDVLPKYRLIYIWIPKCASTTTRMVLSALARRIQTSPNLLHTRRYSGLKSPRRVGISTFCQLVTSPTTLRFSIVRNPYARLVSAWADKFQNKSLVSGDWFVDHYLTYRRIFDQSLPEGPEHTLSFSQFVQFATATAHHRLDPHWTLQDDFLNMPGITLNFIGKVESFDRDFTRVIDHVRAWDRLRPIPDLRFNASEHQPWPSCYTNILADTVYRAYERDFDQFGYPRKIPTL